MYNHIDPDDLTLNAPLSFETVCDFYERRSSQVLTPLQLLTEMMALLYHAEPLS